MIICGLSQEMVVCVIICGLSHEMVVCVPVKRFNPDTFMGLSNDNAWIANDVCHGVFHVQ